jgi:hypothetical protein
VDHFSNGELLFEITDSGFEGANLLHLLSADRLHVPDVSPEGTDFDL